MALKRLTLPKRFAALFEKSAARSGGFPPLRRGGGIFAASAQNLCSKLFVSRLLEAEHMVERETAGRILKPMEPEQPASDIADQHIAGLARRTQRRFRKMLSRPDDL